MPKATHKKQPNWPWKPGQCHLGACASFVASWCHDFMLCLVFKEFPMDVFIKSKHLSLASTACQDYTISNDFLSYSMGTTLIRCVSPRSLLHSEDSLGYRRSHLKKPANHFARIPRQKSHLGWSGWSRFYKDSRLSGLAV